MGDSCGGAGFERQWGILAVMQPRCTDGVVRISSIQSSGSVHVFAISLDLKLLFRRVRLAAYSPLRSHYISVFAFLVLVDHGLSVLQISYAAKVSIALGLNPLLVLNPRVSDL